MSMFSRREMLKLGLTATASAWPGESVLILNRERVFKIVGIVKIGCIATRC
jgi:hypothetical protein